MREQEPAQSTRLQSVDIVIPTYNGKKYLHTCLTSIFRQSWQSFSVIVVDNGSTDGSLDYVKSNFTQVRLIGLPENRGFSCAVNAGIKAGESPLIFLLNNDTELAGDCLEKLVQAAAASSDHFFAPRMLSFTDHSRLDGAGDGFLRGGVGYRLGTMEKDGPPYDRPAQVFGACGGAALYRRSMLQQIGLFDEDFFAYLEDVDLNFRANRAGCTCRYVPESVVYHVGSATTGSKINPFTVRLSTRNNLYLLGKNYPLAWFVRFFPAIAVYQLCWLLFVIKKLEFPAYLAGLAGFVRGLPLMLAKRKSVQAAAAISERDLASRVLAAERAVVESIMRRRGEQGKSNWLLQQYARIFLRAGGPWRARR
jgi:GT2 family glycosyltransferase